jgi:D-3-phosphoglycerate dehydrogenase
VADLAVALILTSLRNIVEGDRIVRAGQWIQPLGRELRGLTVGVVGTGLIGREVIKRLAGFEPRLVAYDVVQSPEVIERYAVRYLSLDELLANSDVVTLHAPLLPETRGLIGERALALIKPTAYLVNTARGPLIDERALAAALASGRLAGAALDVFEVEPLPADSPLRSVQHLIMTPHIAGGTEQSRLAMAKMAVENAARILRGEPPLSCLNPEVLNRTLAGA